jgi:hypothetical protein
MEIEVNSLHGFTEVTPSNTNRLFSAKLTGSGLSWSLLIVDSCFEKVRRRCGLITHTNGLASILGYYYS